MAARMGLTLTPASPAGPATETAATRIEARCRQCPAPQDCERLIDRDVTLAAAPGFCVNLHTLRFLRDYQPHLGLMPPVWAAEAPASGRPAPECP